MASSSERTDADAIVVGAGVIGAAITLELARAGRRVVCIDRLSGAGYGSTSASSAVVRFNYSTRAGVAMAYESLQYWRSWADYLSAGEHMAAARFVECGLAITMTTDEAHARALPHFDELGVPYELLSADEMRKRFEYLDVSEFGPPTRLDDPRFWAEPTRDLVGFVYTPEAGFVTDPRLATQDIADAARRAGASFRYRSEVTAITRRDGRVSGVELGDGTAIRAAVVINAVGPHSAALNRIAGVTADMNVSTRPLRREVYVLPTAQTPGNRLKCAISDLDLGFYARPEAGNMLLVGGIEAPCDPLEWLDDPDASSDHLDHDEHLTMATRAARRFPGAGVPHVARGVTGVYDVSDDWLPIYDRTALDGYYVAIGTSGNQFKNAPMVGHCMTQLVTAVEAGHDHDAQPLVVSGSRLGLDIDLGTFSRLRQPNPASVSVLG